MSEIYTAAHTESAIDLYELRLSWLDEADISANEFSSVEARLNASLYDCAPAPHAEQEKNKKEPAKEAECFVYLACRINAEKPEINNYGYDLAYQWLALDAKKSAAAEAALSLYPETDQTRLIELYDEQKTLRPALFRLFRKQMQTLPLAMVSTAATAEDSSPELKAEAIQYAAANPDIGLDLDLFRTHYVPLLSGRIQFEASIVAAALWGGMVRDDADATKAIGAALSHAGSVTDHAKLLRLAALSGNAEYLPLLLMAAENNPDTGYPHLVLFGQKSVMPEILKGLATAHTMEQAAAAFTQLTDQILPRVPRLTVVGEETEDAEESPEQIPDIKVARTWWEQLQANWKADERWLFGKPATATHLAAMSNKHAGRFGRDIMALLTLAQKAPLNIPWEIWRERQQQLLAEQSATKPATQTPVKPTGARHA